MAMGLTSHNVRQPYLYGRMKPGATREDMLRLLQGAGFEHDYIAWVDPEEVLSMRKQVDVIYQYHVRLFLDGEVRGHHEFGAESHPFKHLYDVGMTDGAPYLKPLLSSLVEELPSPEISFRNNTQGETS